ncbi:hypothetical protein AKG07_02860 [Microbacterium sp. CGR1]|uniref:hypothetical protein n=1 Tax=Microbacterium sp. CGR1 TaxID=1696072 RepID=UPI00069FFB27|nr:hypothetical protein [Microbacterium sp. CGR1]AKV85405.1 hypothetical protein AKG07_02860 [Microbacterium sp. CGR1]
MAMSFEEFRASLTRADLRAPLGLQLTDLEARQVADDTASAQSWYAYWVSTQPTAPPPPTGPAYDAPPPAYDAPPPAYDTAPVYATQVPAPAGPPVYPGYTAAPDGPPGQKRRVGLWVAISIVGALLLIAAIVVIFAFATARHWTKTDVPEQPETFRSEEYETGRYDVTMDDVNPCSVNQDWTDCTNLMVATYTAACVDVELTESATRLCAEYSVAIDEMKAQDGDGYFVATLGSYGSLHRTPEIDTRQVSNDDYEPAVTHEAVCYLGFIGECEEARIQ